MKTYMIILSAIGLSLLACKKNKDKPDSDRYVLDCTVAVSFVNANGHDLLDTSTPGAYAFDQIKLYYKINDSIKEVYDPNMDSPRNIKLIKDSGPRKLMITTYSEVAEITNSQQIKNGTAITYLKLDSLDKDTIETEWEQGANYFVNKKIRYNGVEQPTHSPFVIVK